MRSCTFGVVVFPGSNCDRDVAHVTRGLLGYPTRLIWQDATQIEGCDVVVLPGGFSYGDYLRCGALARFAPVMSAVADHARRGGYVLGICNGFQILLEAGLLPGALMRNPQLQFICDRIPLVIERTDTVWTHRYSTGAEITLPIAHGEGCYTCDPDTLARLQDQRQIVMRYRDPVPNGSVAGIAAISNPEGTILGMMPHPERAADPALNWLGNHDPCAGLPLWQSVTAAVLAENWGIPPENPILAEV